MKLALTSVAASARDLEQIAPLFAALSDATRLGLVARLSCDGPQAISTLAEGATVSRQAVSKHLRALEAVGLAASRRRGRERIYELRPECLTGVYESLDQVTRHWDEALARLRAFVEQD